MWLKYAGVCGLKQLFTKMKNFSKVTTLVEPLDKDAVCVEHLKLVIKVAKIEEQLFEVHGFKYLMESMYNMESYQLSLAD